MLESYFMQADFLASRLGVLKERIDDTEDLVGIELDTRRNELVALQLLVTLATAGLAVVSTVGSLLGMNLAPLPIEASVRPFYFITFGSLAGGVVLFGGTLWWARSRRILWIPKVPRD
jgi:magnesium transporter